MIGLVLFDYGVELVLAGLSSGNFWRPQRLVSKSRHDPVLQYSRTFATQFSVSIQSNDIATSSSTTAQILPELSGISLQRRGRS